MIFCHDFERRWTVLFCSYMCMCGKFLRQLQSSVQEEEENLLVQTRGGPLHIFITKTQERIYAIVFLLGQQLDSGDHRLGMLAAALAAKNRRWRLELNQAS